MGRTKAFDPEAILNQALMLFWQQGYHATSVADLEKDLKINKFSIYNTYGNKHSLFVKALDLYIEQRFTPLLTVLKQSHLGLNAITMFFDALQLALQHQEDKLGCFVVSSGAELSESDAEVKQRVQWVYGQLEDGFYACLEAAQQAKQIRPDLPLQDMARFLLVQSQGMLAVTRNQQDTRSISGSHSFLKFLLADVSTP